MEVLKQQRQKIDQIDRQLVDLLRQRYDVIHEVCGIKAQHNIPAALPDRIAEVRENAAHYAASLNLDEDFVRHLWAQLIDHAIALEEEHLKDK